MANSTMSLYALYKYNPKLFDDVDLPNDVDKQTLIDNLLIECAEMEILYTNPYFLQEAITVWSKKQLHTWSSLADTFNLAYNPIWNVDAHEEIERIVTSNGVDVNKVTGFNSNELTTNNSIDSINNADEKIINDRGGNIGVTTTQKMLKEELEIRPQLNIINYIIKDFKQHFCLLVY